MSDLVQLTKDGGVAVITINHPPVNALSPGVPEGIGEAIEQIEKDDSVVTAVLIGAGRTFVAGADIKEFGKMTSGKTPRGEGFKRLLLPIEDCRKPVVVAIHGTAFGGGLELAMAGHYRCGGSRCAGRPARSEARRIVGARAAVRAPGRTREDF